MGTKALHFNPAVIGWENIIFNITCLPNKKSFALALNGVLYMYLAISSIAHVNLTQCLSIDNEKSSHPGEISQLAGGRSAGYLQ